MIRRLWARSSMVVAAQALAVVLFLVWWESAANGGTVNPTFWSRPSDVWDKLRQWAEDGTLEDALGSTMRVFVVGYLAGMASGIVIGTALGTSRWVREVAEPFIAFFNSMPRLVLLPLLIVWFGFGFTPRYVLVVLVIVVLVAINVAAGLREVRQDLLDNALVMGAGRRHLVGHVYVPSIALWLTTTARVTVGFALNATIAAEFIGAGTGIGHLIVNGQARFRASEIFAALTVVVVVAVLLDVTLRVVERRATRWLPSA